MFLVVIPPSEPRSRSVLRSHATTSTAPHQTWWGMAIHPRTRRDTLLRPVAFIGFRRHVTRRPPSPEPPRARFGRARRVHETWAPSSNSSRLFLSFHLSRNETCPSSMATSTSSTTSSPSRHRPGSARRPETRRPVALRIASLPSTFSVTARVKRCGGEKSPVGLRVAHLLRHVGGSHPGLDE